ncbi:ATPase SWSAP1 [Mizuhopecten yessoensis]|uniref:ATPase SWSAP1 n=1 Tax=Mizuhopecten yessoensis TaxID=6573 RepID=A0A210PW98_MIZYE|nr:ATPase SWSAP1 [Mizuhopecten yessoensis]
MVPAYACLCAIRVPEELANIRLYIGVDMPWTLQFEDIGRLHYDCCTAPHRAVYRTPGSIDITSLLFQGAVSCGAKDFTVVFICPHPLDKIPSGVHGMPKPEANILQHVHFQYLMSIEELINYCASIHTRSVMPDVIMVDDLNHYLGQEKKGEHGLAKMCALLLDTVTFISSRKDVPKCKEMQNTLRDIWCKELHYRDTS